MPILHLLAGPNASGKTTFFERVLEPTLHIPFINADRIASVMWPGDEEAHAYDASRAAAKQRGDMLLARRSFIAETVFSHPSKLALVKKARQLGYFVTLHVFIVPEELTVARAKLREQQGGHSVPEMKVRARFHRLWPLVALAIQVSNEAKVYDNTRAATPFLVVARYLRGRLVGQPQWPSWSPLPIDQ